jgi:hypothetical protein
MEVVGGGELLGAGWDGCGVGDAGLLGEADDDVALSGGGLDEVDLGGGEDGG